MSVHEKNQYQNIDINIFFNESSETFEEISTGLAVLTPNEEELYKKMLSFLRKTSPESVSTVEHSLKELQILSASIDQFPSLLEKQTLTGGVRTPKLLINQASKPG